MSSTGLAALLRRPEQGASSQCHLAGVFPYTPRELRPGAAHSAPHRLGGHCVAEALERPAG